MTEMTEIFIKKIFEISILIRLYCKLLRISMGSDFIPDPQGVHQHSLEWPEGAYAPMHPPVSAPDSSSAMLKFREYSRTAMLRIADIEYCGS